jgi:hypothetical protein
METTMLLWDENHPGIYVDQCSADLTAKVTQHLNTIRSGGIGRDLLDLISKRCQGIGRGTSTLDRQTVIIVPTADDRPRTKSTQRDREVAQDAPPGSVVRLSGGGTGAVVRYDPDRAYEAVGGILTPAYIALAHELIHALHGLSGDLLEEYSWETQGALREEARTVGIGPYCQQRISENAIRKERGLPLRQYYAQPGDVDALGKQVAHPVPQPPAPRRKAEAWVIK